MGREACVLVVLPVGAVGAVGAGVVGGATGGLAVAVGVHHVAAVRGLRRAILPVLRAAALVVVWLADTAAFACIMRRRHLP